MRVLEPVVEYFKNRGDLTYWEYTALPNDGNRYEIMNGNLIMTPAPKISHQDISRNIEVALTVHVVKDKLGKVLSAPVDIILDQKVILQPELIFISKENSKIITEDNIQGSPDLLIEILSPLTWSYDTVEKKELYEKYGVKEYWIVDPTSKCVDVFVNQNKKFVLLKHFTEMDVLHSSLLSKLELKLSTIFTD